MMRNIRALAVCLPFILFSCATQREAPAAYRTHILEYSKPELKRNIPIGIVSAEQPYYQFPEDTLSILRVQPGDGDPQFPQFAYTSEPRRRPGERGFVEYCELYIKYPSADVDIGLDGRFILRFVVDENGSVESVAVHKPAYDHAICDRMGEAVVKAIETVPFRRISGDWITSEDGTGRTTTISEGREGPLEEGGIWKWEPAVRDGVAVGTVVYLPVVFKIIWR